MFRRSLTRGTERPHKRQIRYRQNNRETLSETRRIKEGGRDWPPLNDLKIYRGTAFTLFPSIVSFSFLVFSSSMNALVPSSRN